MLSEPEVKEMTKEAVDYIALLREKIEANGGYAVRYGERWALAWNVKLHSCGVHERVRDGLVQNYFMNEADARLKYPNLDEFITEHIEREGLNEQVLESMRDSLNGADTYKMVRPEIIERHCYTGRDGNEVPFDMEFGFAGRSGGYVVIAKFEGRDGKRLNDYLDPDKNEFDEWERAWAQRLVMCIEECDLMFAPLAVHQEFDYELGFRIGELLTEKEDDDE